MQIAKKLFKYYLLMISIFTVTRALLFWLNFDRFANSDINYWLSFLYGLKMDTIVASMLLVIPLFILCFTPQKAARIGNLFLRIYFLFIIGFLIYMANATFPFFAQYDVRPNFKFVEYLEYPKEVFSMILADYKLALSIAFGMIALFAWYFLKITKKSFLPILQSSLSKRVLWFFPLAILLFIGIRSSFGHRPANISDAMYSTNRIVNEVTKNSLYSVGYAIYANKKYSSKAIKKYGKMPLDEAIKRVSEKLNIPVKDLNDSSIFSRVAKSRFPTKKRKNLVIFLQESLGYQFISKKITPNLLKLKNEGLWFENLFSNGTRSVRGIAGVTSGFLAVPGKGVVKRTKSQHDFFTFGSLLKPLGYHTMFIYGGEARFDNMRSWFLGNGFDEIIEQKDYKNPTFVSTWGVSDEDLANLANKKFNRLYKKNRPFAALMFSSSNHSPFDIPKKCDPQAKPGQQCVENAVQYADYAIGKFFEKAKKMPYFKDTVFVVVADHNVRVYGDDIVPVNMFHIPALIICDGIKCQTYDKLTTQPDILATALDLMGKDFKYPILGNSIFSKNKPQISLMQFNDSYALREKDKVAIIRPSKKPLTFKYDKKRLKPIDHDKNLEKDALAFVITLNYLYDKRRYK